jgi:hypothetical protein
VQSNVQLFGHLPASQHISPAGTGHVSGNKTGLPPFPIVLPYWPSNGFKHLQVAWFGANATGLDITSTLALIAKHDVGMYGWQQAGNAAHGEAVLSATAAHLTDYLQSIKNNNTIVAVYRQTQVAISLFDINRIAFSDPSYNDIWLKNPTTGDICTASQPWGTLDPYWNFSNPAAVDYWIQNDIAELQQEGKMGIITGAFFDETDQGWCGYWNKNQGGCPPIPAETQAQLQQDTYTMYGTMVRNLNSAGIVPVISSDNRISASNANISAAMPCAIPEDALLTSLAGTAWTRFYENWPSSFWVPTGPDLDAGMIFNAILETAAGVPFLARSPVGGDCSANNTIDSILRKEGDSIVVVSPFAYQLASFLVAMGPSSVFATSSGWYDADWCWHAEYDIFYGAPVAAAVRTGTYTFTRSFTNCDVSVDTTTQTGVITLKKVLFRHDMTE